MIKEHHEGKISSKQFISKIKITVVATILSTNYICGSQCPRLSLFNPYNNPTMNYHLSSTYAQITHLTLLLCLCNKLQVEKNREMTLFVYCILHFNKASIVKFLASSTLMLNQVPEIH